MVHRLGDINKFYQASLVAGIHGANTAKPKQISSANQAQNKRAGAAGERASSDLSLYPGNKDLGYDVPLPKHDKVLVNEFSKGKNSARYEHSLEDHDLTSMKRTVRELKNNAPKAYTRYMNSLRKLAHSQKPNAMVDEFYNRLETKFHQSASNFLQDMRGTRFDNMA